jgi:hypothetical protein
MEGTVIAFRERTAAAMSLDRAATCHKVEDLMRSRDDTGTDA